MADRAQLYNDPEEALRLAFDGRLSSLWTAMPGIIQDVDLAKSTCTVQLTIQGSVEDENGVVQSVTLPLLGDVPIMWPRSAGFAITFPLSTGDEVLVVFASRCIDAWWQSGGIQRSIEARMHDLSDGFALPGPSSQPNVLTNISATNLQIRTEAGTSYIEIPPAGIINIVAPTGINITGNVAITGNLAATGTIGGAGGVASGSINLTTHTHTGVTSGGSNTGGPV